MELKVCALGILFKNGKILLGKRAKHRTSYPNVWDMIGGHCENTETLTQTLIRELQEEIGVTPIQFEHISTLFDSNNDHTYHVFVGNVLERRTGASTTRRALKDRMVQNQCCVKIGACVTCISRIIHQS